MAWWAGKRSRQHGYGTHQEKKMGSRHKRSGDERWALTDAIEPCNCQVEWGRFGTCARCLEEMFGD
jgi:hypothetical protein